ADEAALDAVRGEKAVRGGVPRIVFRATVRLTPGLRRARLRAPRLLGAALVAGTLLAGTLLALTLFTGDLLTRHRIAWSLLALGRGAVCPGGIGHGPADRVAAGRAGRVRPCARPAHA